MATQQNQSSHANEHVSKLVEATKQLLRSVSQSHQGSMSRMMTGMGSPAGIGQMGQFQTENSQIGTMEEQAVLRAGAGGGGSSAPGGTGGTSGTGSTVTNNLSGTSPANVGVSQVGDKGTQPGGDAEARKRAEEGAEAMRIASEQGGGSPPSHESLKPKQQRQQQGGQQSFGSYQLDEASQKEMDSAAEQFANTVAEVIQAMSASSSSSTSSTSSTSAKKQ